MHILADDFGQSVAIQLRDRWEGQEWCPVDSRGRPDMQEAVRILMRPDDMLETFSELAVKQPDLMRLVLQASLATLVNVQSVEAVDGELERKAVVGN